MKKFPDTYNSKQHIYYCFNELHFYKDFIGRYERLIKSENEEYEKFLNNPDLYFELDPRFNFQHDHSDNLSNEFPVALRKSAFISLWSYFEKSLNVLCEVYEYHLSLDVNYSEMKGSGIERSKLYLTKIIKLDFPLSSNWEKIKKLQKVRNKIVHTYSEISNEDAELVRVIEDFPYLRRYPLNSTSLIEIEECFLESVIEIFEIFYRELLESIIKREEIAAQ